jgi:hypothetical protein
MTVVEVVVLVDILATAVLVDLDQVLLVAVPDQAAVAAVVVAVVVTTEPAVVAA